MGIRFRCHHCEHELNVKDHQAGKKTRCPTCGGRFRIPMATSDYSLAVEEKVGAAAAATSESASQSVSEKEQPIAAGKNDLKQAAREAPSDAESTVAPSTSPDAEAQWYVRPPSGGQFGPANQAVFEQWLGEHRITADSLVWRDGWTDWLVAEQALPNQFPGAEAAAVSKQAASPESHSASNAPQSDLPQSKFSAAAASTMPPATAAAVNARDLSLSERNRLDRRRKKRRNYRITIGVLTLLAVGLLIGLIVALVLQQGE